MPNSDSLAAGAAVAGSAINAFSTSNLNRRNRKWSEQMYERQKADAISFWNMQNEYNSPQAQMARFQAAGLNPNLIYGQSNNAGPVNPPSMDTPQTRVPEFGNVGVQALAALSAVADLDIKQAQYDNLKAQNTILLEDAMLRRTQVADKQFDLEFKQDFRDVSGDALRENLRRLRTQTDLSLNEDARRAALNSVTVEEAKSRMLTAIEQRSTLAQQRAQSRAEVERIRMDVRRIKEDIYLKEREGVLKELEIGLRKMNISPNDPIWSRMVAKVLSEEGTQGGFDVFKNLWTKDNKPAVRQPSSFKQYLLHPFPNR